MAISAFNSLNFNRVAFKGAQAAPKTETANKPQGEDSFLEENKEAIIGLATIGAAVLAGYAAHKTGLVGKIFHKKPTAAAELININDRAYNGTVGNKAINKIKNAVQTAKINEQIAEFGADGTRHAARIESKYEETLPEIFAEGAKVNSREDILSWAKAEGLLTDKAAA